MPCVALNVMENPVVLQIENVIISTDIGRPINIRNLIEYGEAFKDIDFAAAKYAKLKRVGAANKRGAIVVNVFQSGKIACTGAKSIEAAKEYLNEILAKLRIKNCVLSISLLVVSGVIRERIDLEKALPAIYRNFPTSSDITLFSGIYIRGEKVMVQVFTSDSPVRLVCRGPDMESISGMISDIYNVMRGSG